jgi:hypothetical protein
MPTMICARCGGVAVSREIIDEPVVHAESGRPLGWTRTLARYGHADGMTHDLVMPPRIPIPAPGPRGARLVMNG